MIEFRALLDFELMIDFEAKEYSDRKVEWLKIVFDEVENRSFLGHIG